MKRTCLTTAIAALVVSGPVLAAQLGQADQTSPPEQTQQKPANEQPSAGAGTEQAGAIEFISSQKESDWLTSSLMGRNVQNTKGETLGDINNIVLDQNGEVVAVLIGVGGFLGLGGKDVAVNYSALEFKERKVSQPTATGEDARKSAFQNSANPGTANPLIEQQKERMAAEPPRKDANHSDMVIVLNATYEQLESAPSYTRLGQEEVQNRPDSAPAEKQDKLKTQEKPSAE